MRTESVAGKEHLFTQNQQHNLHISTIAIQNRTLGAFLDILHLPNDLIFHQPS
jgi:hypothetical protein